MAKQRQPGVIGTHHSTGDIYINLLVLPGTSNKLRYATTKYIKLSIHAGEREGHIKLAHFIADILGINNTEIKLSGHFSSRYKTMYIKRRAISVQDVERILYDNFEHKGGSKNGWNKVENTNLSRNIEKTQQNDKERFPSRRTYDNFNNFEDKRRYKTNKEVRSRTSRYKKSDQEYRVRSSSNEASSELSGEISDNSDVSYESGYSKRKITRGRVQGSRKEKNPKPKKGPFKVENYAPISDNDVPENFVPISDSEALKDTSEEVFDNSESFTPTILGRTNFSKSARRKMPYFYSTVAIYATEETKQIFKASVSSRYQNKIQDRKRSNKKEKDVPKEENHDSVLGNEALKGTSKDTHDNLEYFNASRSGKINFSKTTGFLNGSKRKTVNFENRVPIYATEETFDISELSMSSRERRDKENDRKWSNKKQETVLKEEKHVFISGSKTVKGTTEEVHDNLETFTASRPKKMNSIRSRGLLNDTKRTIPRLENTIPIFATEETSSISRAPVSNGYGRRNKVNDKKMSNKKKEYNLKHENRISVSVSKEIKDITRELHDISEDSGTTKPGQINFNKSTGFANSTKRKMTNFENRVPIYATEETFDISMSFQSSIHGRKNMIKDRKRPDRREKNVSEENGVSVSDSEDINDVTEEMYDNSEDSGRSRNVRINVSKNKVSLNKNRKSPVTSGDKTLSDTVEVALENEDNSILHERKLKNKKLSDTNIKNASIWDNQVSSDMTEDMSENSGASSESRYERKKSIKSKKALNANEPKRSKSKYRTSIESFRTSNERTKKIFDDLKMSAPSEYKVKKKTKDRKKLAKKLRKKLHKKGRKNVGKRRKPKP